MSLVIYLATPYNHPDPEVREQRYRRALEYATILLGIGAFVYSPILHNHHPIAIKADLGRGWEFWKAFDCALIERCDILAVAQIEGWQESVGIKAEESYARSIRMPIRYLSDPLTEESLDHLTRLAMVVSKHQSLSFRTVSKVNYERALLWHKGGLEEWTVSDWAVAMAGEAGEVCDAIKKLRRIECAVESNNVKQPANREVAIKAIAQEIGDTFVYLDLLAQRLGLPIEECIRETFNRISIREKMPQRL